MRRWVLVALGLSVLAACRAASVEPSHPRPPPPPPAPPTGLPPVPEWVPSEASLANNATLAPNAADPDGGMLAAGLRMSPNGVWAHDVANPALMGGTRVPARLGGGFLFWNGKALYFSKSFTAPLEPVTALPSTLERASFGAGYVLLHLAVGGRWALSLPGRQRVAMPAAGLIDTALGADGRAVSLLEPGRVWVAGAGGRAWRDVSAQARDVRALHASGDGLFLELANRHAVRVEADGGVTELDSLPEALRAPVIPRDPRWPASISESPRTRAIRRGLPLSEHVVLVEAAGAFVRVDLATGELIRQSPALVAGPGECQLLPAGDHVLALCRTATGSTVLSKVESNVPEVEKVFGSQASFFAGQNGSLLLAAPCDGAPEPERAVACVRQPNGTWRELGEPKRASDAGPSDAGSAKKWSVTRWIPTSEGGAIGLAGGDTGGIFDAASGAFTPFSRDGYKTESQLFSPRSELVVDDFALAADGSVVGYLWDHATVLRRDGAIDRSPHSFSQLKSAGPLGLASDREGRLWQSSDYGLTFHEVARPAGVTAQLSIAACSRAGCDLGDWYRLGFRPSTPSPFKLDPAAPAAVPAASAAQKLVCERLATPQTRWVTRARRADGSLSEQFEFGARKLSVKFEAELAPITLAFDLGTRDLMRGATLAEALFEQPAARGWAALPTKPRTFRFVEPFGEPKVVESRFTWAELFRLNADAGNGPPNPLVQTDRTAVPVLGTSPGTSDGLLMLDLGSNFSWLRAGRPARAISLGGENASFVPASAAVRDKDELIVLAADNECATRILSVGSAGARVLAELPRRPGKRGCAPNPDALGLGADGSLGVLRILSHDAPAKDDPALFLVPGREPVTLAPLSTLVASEACPADASAARALVQLGAGWIGLLAPGLGAEEKAGIAIVRWGKTHVCLEALELSTDSVTLGEQELATSIVARFVKPESATRRGFALGAEHVERLACKLAAAH